MPVTQRRHFLGTLASAWVSVGCSASHPGEVPGTAGSTGSATGGEAPAGALATGGAESSGPAGGVAAGGQPQGAGTAGVAEQSAGAGGAASSGVPPILDTHTHFFDPARPTPPGRSSSVPWPSPSEALYKTTLPGNYLGLAEPLGIDRMLVVEASAWLEDNQWVLDLARTSPSITGFVGNLSEALATSEFEQAVATYAKNPLFRGIRVGVDRLTDDNLSRFAALASRGMMVEVLAWPSDLSRVQELASMLPSLRVVIDHLANPKVDGQAPGSAWATGIREVAKRPNVYCKVSSLVDATGMKGGNAPAQVDFYRSTLDVVFDAFGEDRLMFGSNWPVSSVFAPLATVVGIVRSYFAEKPQPVAEKFFSKNALAVYGL